MNEYDYWISYNQAKWCLMFMVGLSARRITEWLGHGLFVRTFAMFEAMLLINGVGLGVFNS